MTRASLLLAALPTLLALICGCESEPEGPDPRPVVNHTPLELDPMDAEPLAEWWSDGNSLLRLRDDGRYTRVNSTNPYTTPAQRGRWVHTSYAALWLEPYDTSTPQRVRVGISKVNDEVVLTVPAAGPMVALSSQPAAVEDYLLGDWSGGPGSLDLGSDLRYSFGPSSDESDESAVPSMRVGHHGTWHVDGTTVVLDPQPQGLGPYRLRIEVEDENLTLTGGGMAFARLIDHAGTP